MTPQELIQRALELQRAGRLADAEALYRQVLAQNPNHPHALYLLGGLAHGAGKLEAAVDLVGKAAAAAPDNGEIHGQLGLLLGQVGRLDEAVASYQRALALHENWPAAWNNLGIIQERRGDLEQAAHCFERAVQLQPDFPQTWSNLGNILCRLRRYGEAVAAFEKLVASQPQSYPAIWSLAGAQQLAGQHDRAIANLRKLVGIGPQTSDQALYCSLTDTGLLKAKAEAAAGGDAMHKLPYLGDKVVLLNCDRATRERLRKAGLHGGYAIDSTDGSEIWLSAQLASGRNTQRLPEVIRQWLDWIRNEAAMSGTTAAAWLPRMPEAVANAIRQVVGADLIEITGENFEAIESQLRARAVTPRDTEGKIFALVSIRNGGLELLPHWLEHYTQLGVDEILLGVFDDLVGESAAEIAACAQRFKFHQFVQRWNSASEAEQYSQRQAGCRAAGARPGTWILHTDLDELQQFPASVQEVAAAAEKKGMKAIYGQMVDRVAADGTLPPIRPQPSLWEQFSMECRLTDRVLSAETQKVMLTRFSVGVSSGHHESLLESPGPPPLGDPAEYRVAHFKWHAGLLPRLRWGLSQPAPSSRWKREAQRFISWVEHNGGRIDLADPRLESKEAKRSR